MESEHKRGLTRIGVKPNKMKRCLWMGCSPCWESSLHLDKWYAAPISLWLYYGSYMHSSLNFIEVICASVISKTLHFNESCFMLPGWPPRSPVYREVGFGNTVHVKSWTAELGVPQWPPVCFWAWREIWASLTSTVHLQVHLLEFSSEYNEETRLLLHWGTHIF